MEKHSAKINMMIDSVIAQYGYESSYTISFCTMCEDYEQHGLFSMRQIENYYMILREE